jgi:hypothetical protein
MFYVIEGSGGADKSCSNAIGDAMTGVTMFETVEECCATFCGDNDKCSIIDICETAVPTVAPTAMEVIETPSPVTSIPTML